MNRISLLCITTLIIGTSVFLWKRAHKVTPGPDYNTVTVGTNAEFPPFSMKENNVIVGFDIDVTSEVFKRLNKKVVFKDLPFDALIPELQLGNIHVIAAGITPTEKRRERVLFTKPHLTSDSLYIISLKDKNITDFHKLKGKTVVVNEGYTADYYMSTQPNINVIRISGSTTSEGILALQAGRADAFVTGLLPMKPYFDIFGTDTFTIVKIEDTQESSAFAVSKHYPELRDYIAVTLERMEEDGTLAALKKKWNFV